MFIEREREEKIREGTGRTQTGNYRGLDEGRKKTRQSVTRKRGAEVVWESRLKLVRLHTDDLYRTSKCMERQSDGGASCLDEDG